MLQPWRRPEDGKFYLRARVPADLVGIAGKKLYRYPLNTKDPKEARDRWPGALRHWEQQKAEWRRSANAVALTEAHAAELAVEWARAVCSGALPLDRAGGDEFHLLPSDADFYSESEWNRLAQRAAFHAEEALRLAGITATESTRAILDAMMQRPVNAAYLEAALHELGWRGDPHNPAMAPLTSVLAAHGCLDPPPSPTPPATSHPLAPPSPQAASFSGPVRFEELFQGWKRITQVKPRTVEDTGYILTGLKVFLGHDDAGRVSTADIRRWRDHCLREGLSNNTFNNRLSLVGQVFARGVADERIAADPTRGMRLPKSRTATRLPYSDDDAVRILLAARREAKPSLRWAHFVMAFTGMRVGEVLQLTGGDIRQDPSAGVYYIAVHETDAGKSVKNGRSRSVPLHPALLEEGFLDYARGIAPDAPLFPEKRKDKFGQRGGRGWNQVGEWVRKTVGIVDPRLSPNHSWRHRMEDELRAAGVPEDARDAILGHERATTGRLYGQRGESLARLSEALAKVPVPEALNYGWARRPVAA